MTKHWTKLIAVAVVAWAAAPAAAETLEVTSPDGTITVTVKDDGGQATYAVSYQGKQVIAPSKLGMLFAEHHGFERGLAIAGSTRASKDTTWEQPWGERRLVRDQHNELAVTFKPADGPDRLPPACTIPVAEGQACDLDAYVPGTNASIFSPQGGVRIGMLDLAKIGQAFVDDRAFFSDRAKQAFDRAWKTSFHPGQEFFCIYGLHLQIIDSPQGLWANAEQPKPTTCRDELFGDGVARVGHSGEAYGLQSGLWFDLGSGRGFAYFLTQAPPPAGGEDTGGFTPREKALTQRALVLTAERQR